MAYKSQNDLISKFQLSNNFLLQIVFKIIFNSFSTIFLIIFTILFCYDYKKKQKIVIYKLDDDKYTINYDKIVRWKEINGKIILRHVDFKDKGISCINFLAFWIIWEN